jgi:NAD(P)-dependent dehydrogenase (short-subunit alcohol dehydrogenase family)
MIDFWKKRGPMISQDWSHAVRNVLTYQWNLIDAQYQSGLRMMEAFLPVKDSKPPPAAAESPPRPEYHPNGGAAPASTPRRGKEGDLHIANKVAVVTGAASGIGEAVSRELARRGAKTVVLVDRSDRVADLVRSINETIDRPVAVAKVGDATSDAFRVQVFDEVVADHGVVHICVPAAGITRDSLAVKVDKASGKAVVYPTSTFREVVEVNLIAPTYWALEMVARIAEDRTHRGLGRWSPEEEIQGTVVFIGSVSSQGNKGQISYAATKAGLEGAAATLMKEAMYHGVRCGVIHPGFTDTPMVRAMGEEYIAKNVLPYTQLRRLIRPDEIADAICFMISNSAVSGELWADAGWHPSA